MEVITDSKPLFIVGHKRSGSTLLARILNLHQSVFVSSESDILWILYQFVNDLEFKAYQYDGPRAMEKCLKKYGYLLDKNRSVYENFLEIQQALMKDGFIHLDKMNKVHLQYVGDQKPFQNADPRLVGMVYDFMPEPYYIHLIRHPVAVVRSCRHFANGKGGWMWGDTEDHEILRQWVLVEDWILKLKKERSGHVLDIRYEDLISEPLTCFKKIFDFLNLDWPEVINPGMDMIRKNPRKDYEVDLSDEARRVMEIYNYL